MILPLTRLAKIVGSIPREPPKTFEEFQRGTYPDLYNTFREILFLLQKMRLESGAGISIVDDGKTITITNLNP